LTRLMDLLKLLPTQGPLSRASVTLGVSQSVAMGGRGIAIDHPLAGVGHRLGKVLQTLAEVDDDPAGLKKQRGKEYLKNLKKW
jgi:hypothetical protein